MVAMNRRELLKKAALTTAAVGLIQAHPRFASQLIAAPANLRADPMVVDVRDLNSLLHNRFDTPADLYLSTNSVAIAAFNAGSLVRGFGSLLRSIGYSAIVEGVKEWVRNTLRGRAKSTVDGINTKMEAGGFTNYSLSTVYGNGRNHIYMLLHNNKIDICGPQIDIYNSTNVMNDWHPHGYIPLMEGPEVAAITLSGIDMFNRGDKAGDVKKYLIPVGTAVDREGNSARDRNAKFSQTMEESTWYHTQDGYLGIDYTKTRTPNQGVVDVVALDKRMEEVFANRYPIQYNAA